MMIDGKSLVHNHLDRLKPNHRVNDWGKCRSHSTYDVSVGENHVAQLRFVGAIFNARRLDNIANLNV